MEQTTKYSKWALAVLFMSMIIMAMSTALKGVLVPQWREEFYVSSSSIAIIFTLETIALMIATYKGGRLIAKWGISRVLIMALLLLALSLLVIGYSPSFIVLLCGMLGQGMGLGLVGLAVNVIVPHFPVKQPAVLMNFVHFCFGLGAATSQRLSGYLIFRQVSWHYFYPVLAGVALIIAIITTKVTFPPFKQEQQTTTDKSARNHAIFLGLIICLGFYLAGEIGTSNWFVNYASQGYDLNANASSFYLSLFFIIFTGGRLLGGFIVEKIPYLLAIAGSLMMSTCFYLYGIWQGANGMLFIAIAGFFQAIVFPTLMLVIADVFAESQALTTANVTTGAYTIYLVLNYSVGFLNDRIGVARSFVIMPLSLVVSIIAALTVYQLVKSRNRAIVREY